MSWSAAAMTVLAIVSVGLWTLRVALAANGRRLAGAAVASVEAVVFALAFSNLVADLGSWERLAGYALGVAVGTIVGLVVNDRLNPGAAIVEVIVPGDASQLRDAFHSRGWPVTTLAASGLQGPVTVLYLVVYGNRTGDVLDVVQDTAPHALWTIRPATAAHGVPGMGTPVSV